MKTQMFPLVRDFDELQDKVKEAVQKGGFSVVDNGFAHEFGTKHEWGAEYSGAVEMKFIVLHPDEGDDGPFRWTERTGGCDGEHPGRCKAVCDEYEVELIASITYLEPVLDGAMKVRVDVEQR